MIALKFKDPNLQGNIRKKYFVPTSPITVFKLLDILFKQNLKCHWCKHSGETTSNQNACFVHYLKLSILF